MKEKIKCPHCGKDINVNIDFAVKKESEDATTPSDEATSSRINFFDMLYMFNNVLKDCHYNEVSSSMAIYDYLLWAWNYADSLYNSDEWMFRKETYPLVCDYRGTDTSDSDNAYNAMQSWLMASILSELVPDSGKETNTQTKLFAAAYSIGGGAISPLYSGKTLKADPYAMREAASVIYAICRGDKNIASSIGTYRDELGGKPINATTWDELGYSNEMLSDEQGRRGYRTKSIGYCVNTSLFLPSASGPRVQGTTVCELPFPWESGQDVSLFDCLTANYIKDEEINLHMVNEWNMMSQTKVEEWDSYPREKQNRLVNVMATPPCTFMYMFGAPMKVKFNGKVNKTYDGKNYADYFTFVKTTEDTGLVIDGAFSDLAGIYRYNQSQKSATELLLQRVTEIADNFRFPTQDPNYGRSRPGCGVTRETTEKNPVHGSPENELYNVDITVMVADNAEAKAKYEKEDGFAADSPRSYVSGHSAQIWMLALMLTQMDEDSTKRPQTWVRKAFEYSINRSIGRYHWMSDVIYGRMFGSMCLPIINAMRGLQDGLNAVRDFVHNPTPTPVPQGDWKANIIVKNLTGAPIQSTGEIRLYVENHIGVNTYLPDAWEGAGALYTFGVGETDFSSSDVHCKMNGEEYMDDSFDGAEITEVRFYDYRHWQNLDVGFNAVLDIGDTRCDRCIKKSGGTYVIEITKI